MRAPPNLRSGCDIDAPNARGDSALHVACANGQEGFVSMLLAAGRLRQHAARARAFRAHALRSPRRSPRSI
eukprot:6196480-Pleurochrysis_carterae.AAC.3